MGAGLFGQEPGGVTFAGRAADDFHYDLISVHSGPAGGLTKVRSSTRQFPMAGFDIAESTGFWSLVQLNDRAAATLHLFFNDDDQRVLEAIAAGVHDLAELVAALEDSPLRSSRPVRMLEALLGPVVASVVRTPSPAGDQLTLAGSCLSGGEVTLDGIPVLGVLEVSDAALQVTVPAGAAGNLVVTTRMGVSAPAPAP